MKHLKIFITGSPKNYTLGPPKRKDPSAPDGLSIMGYDHEVTKWLKGLRDTKPIRTVTKT